METSYITFSRAKQRQGRSRNVQKSVRQSCFFLLIRKKVCCMCKVVVLLIRSIVVFYRSRWALTICTEISVKNFLQMVLVLFFGTENRNRVELYHLQNTGKLFTFSRHEAWHWQSKQMEPKISLVSVRTGKRLYLQRCSFFPENFHRDEPFHLNSPRNFRVFQTNGKRSLFPPCL